jgi:hypothetical protein
MNRIYQYHGVEIAVAVEADFGWKGARGAPVSAGYVAIVKISKADGSVSVFSPLRLGESQGKRFISESDALMSGYSAGRRLVDDLLAS